MNFKKFIEILNEYLVYEPNLSEELKDEWYNEWYILFKESDFYLDGSTMVSEKHQIEDFAEFHFADVNFDTHAFKLSNRIWGKWVKSFIKPPKNLAVLVFIPDEDNHKTTGMWDVDNKWVLLDDYRVVENVSHWMILPDNPLDI